MSDDCSKSFKILLCGESGVGKTSLSNQFTSHRFNSHEQSTVGVDFRSKLINVNGNRVRLMLWDSAGQEQFRSVPPMYYRGADAALFIYDVTNRDTFGKLSDWLKDFHRYNTKEKPVKMLVGNKTDLDDIRTVSAVEGVKFARANEMLFIETSAATADRVDEAFTGLVDMILSQSQTLRQLQILPSKHMETLQDGTIILYGTTAKQPKKTKNCCGAKKKRHQIVMKPIEGGL